MDFREFIESLGNVLGMRFENAGGACGLDIDGVTVMLHDADDLVFLAAEIGSPPPEDGLETLFRAALTANWLYKGTGGATLAINPEDGCIWLEKYNFLERLDGAKGAEMVTRFAETARTTASSCRSTSRWSSAGRSRRRIRRRTPPRSPMTRPSARAASPSGSRMSSSSPPAPRPHALGGIGDVCLKAASLQFATAAPPSAPPSFLV